MNFFQKHFDKKVLAKEWLVLLLTILFTPIILIITVFEGKMSGSLIEAYGELFTNKEVFFTFIPIAYAVVQSIRATIWAVKTLMKSKK